MADDSLGPLAVRFYQKAYPNEGKTAAEGRPVSDMIDFVRIEVPGNQLSIIDTFANRSHQDRFPMQWAKYLNEKAEGGSGIDVQGTMLNDWPILTSAQAIELRHFKFYTVEQIASASDQQIAPLGMMVGMSPYAFRDKAKAYLANAKDSAVVQQQADELRLRDQQIIDLKAQVDRMVQAQLAEPVKRGPGRPPLVRHEEEKES